MKQSPMVNQLYTLNKYKRGGKRHTTALGDKSRMNIVSEKLCGRSMGIGRCQARFD